MTKEEFEALKQEADILSCSEIFDVYFERLANAVEKATKEKAAYLRKEVELRGTHSEDYENGFWDGLELYEAAIRSMK